MYSRGVSPSDSVRVVQMVLKIVNNTLIKSIQIIKFKITYIIRTTCTYHRNCIGIILGFSRVVFRQVRAVFVVRVI